MNVPVGPYELKRLAEGADFVFAKVSQSSRLKTFFTDILIFLLHSMLNDLVTYQQCYVICEVSN